LRLGALRRSGDHRASAGQSSQRLICIDHNEEVIMGVARNIVKKIGSTFRSVRAGSENLAATKVGSAASRTLEVTSSVFSSGQTLPRASTADGEGLPPPLTWNGVPGNARSMVVICEDPDAPLPEPFVHWLVYGIPARPGTADATDPGTANATAVGTLDVANLGSVRQGENSKGGKGYTAAAPPPGHGVHHYHFQVFALDEDLALEPGAGRSALLEAMRGHVVAWGDLVGTYERR
jgi:Raf kinase inhibitor-like YbhB/YbcL family protein